MIENLKLIGKVERTYSDSNDCICCEGKHVTHVGIGIDVNADINEYIQSLPDYTQINIIIQAEAKTSGTILEQALRQKILTELELVAVLSKIGGERFSYSIPNNIEFKLRITDHNMNIAIGKYVHWINDVYDIIDVVKTIREYVSLYPLDIDLSKLPHEQLKTIATQISELLSA